MDLIHCSLQFYLPTIFDFGWCLYAWDMQRKIINIFDPSYGASTTQRRKHLLEAVADKLHVAFFTLIYKLFSNWHVDCIRWEKKISRDVTHHSPAVSLCFPVCGRLCSWSLTILLYHNLQEGHRGLDYSRGKTLRWQERHRRYVRGNPFLLLVIFCL